MRRNVFETNSSSTHSFSISSEGERTDLYLGEIEDGVLSVEPGEFGWEVETYFDAETKLSYLVTYMASTSISSLSEHGYYNRLLEVVQEYIPEVQCIDVIASEWSYIDHQSWDMPKIILEEQEGSLADFLFNPNSTLETDNDNH